MIASIFLTRGSLPAYHMHGTRKKRHGLMLQCGECNFPAKPLPHFAGNRAVNMKKAIILSAGQGSRLGHLTDNKPKCLIEFNGRTLLDRQLDALAANSIDEVVVVTGFRDDQIEGALARRGDIGPRVRTVYNPFYKVADNLGSLFVAREEIAGDVLVWNGDTLVSEELMARVVGNQTQDGICVTIDRKDGYDEDDMKVVVDDAGRLHAIGKRLDLAEVNAESIGLLAFRGAGAQTFRHAIERAIRTSEGTTIWYLRVIHQIAQEAPVWTLDINGHEWGEVDFPEDVESAQALTARWDAIRKPVAA
jgi:L-glutamine-phosphate cytidylyltransferase